MRISGLYVDGFGIFHDQLVSDLGQTLVLFQGHNEAGKSTLLGFLRSVLFGFPRANARDAAYLPAGGGVHGGRIDLVSATGEPWSVSRKPGKGGGTVTVTGSDGQEHDPSMLDTLLGGISYEAFKSIMAFGLGELQTMETLSGEHVTNAIYGAGFGTAMTTMPTALKQIRKRMDELFKNRASNPVINRIAGELDQVRKSLHEAALQVETYDSLFDELSRTEKELEALRDDLSGCRREAQRYDALERLWPDWIAFSDSRNALDQLPPPVAAFPEEGLETLEKLADRREHSSAALRELKNRHGQLSGRLSRLPVDEKILARASDITGLMENRKGHLEDAATLPLLSRETAALQEKVDRLLSRLGTGWNETAVLRFDRSLFTRETIRQHQTALDAIDKKIGAAAPLFRDKKTTFNEAADACRRAQKELSLAGELPPLRDPAPLRRLREGRDRYYDALVAHRQISEDLTSAGEEFSRLLAAAGREPAGLKWPGLGIVLVGLAGAGSLFYFGSTLPAALTLGAVPVALLAAWIYLRQKRQLYWSRQETCRQQQRRVEELSRRRQQLASIQGDYGHWAKTAGAGVPDLPTGEALLEAVDRLFTTVTEEERQRELITRARQRLDEKKVLAETARNALEETTRNLEALKRDRAQAQAEWEGACSRLGLGTPLSPETALEALDVIDDILDTLQQRDRHRTEESRLRDRLAHYRETARQLLSAVAWPGVSDEDLPRSVSDLQARLEESRGNQRETEALGRQVAEIEKQVADTESDLADTTAAICRLLEAAGIPDEAAFQKAGRLERQRTALLEATRTAEGNMRRISGEVDATALKAHLESLTLPEISARKERATETARTLEGDLSTLYARRAEEKQTLENLGSNQEISRLRAREAALLADLSEHVREWSRHALAEHLILRSREIYERKHQPEIIKIAGDIFSRMTDGKYQGVVSPLGENSLQAVSDRGERILPGELSRGTAEQLYLAVRFSYILHQARQQDPLPVIMDDILVNFDPIRAAKAAEAILALSATHQVLFFTCHPETVDLFRDIDPELPVFTLEAGRIFPPEPTLLGKKRKSV